jgi:hypothetical protein
LRSAHDAAIVVPIRMKHALAALIVTATFGIGTRTLAHHSFAAAYDDERMMTIAGEVVQVLLRNPHSFVHVIVREPGKEPIRYSVEWTSLGRLGDQGVTGGTLRAGDRVVITGQPSRDLDLRWLRMTMLRRPKDGFVWESSSDPMN